MESIMVRDPELEASFSFSCHAVFSDDEEGNDDQYIEIALEQPTNTYGHDDGCRDQDQLEFRISFSSAVPFLHLSNTSGLARADTEESIGSELSETVTTPSSSTSTSTSTSTLSFSSAETCWAAATSETTEPPAKTQNTIKRRVQFRSVNHLLNSFMSNPAASSEMVNNQNELVRGRKATKITKTTNGGIVMRFLIKCQSINIRTILATFMKPYQFIYSPGAKMKRSKENNESVMMKPFEKWLVQREKAKGERSRARMFDIKLNAIRGVLETMSTSLSCKDKKTNKCPSGSDSTRSSIQQQGYPIESNSNSIQAAIAHCKRSYGQTSEFRF